MSYTAASSHKTFPPPLGIGSSIAALGADRPGSLGAYSRLVDREKAEENTVILTSSHGIAREGYRGETNIAIQSPSRKDIKALLTSEQDRLDIVSQQIERLRAREAVESSAGNKANLADKLIRIEEIPKKIQSIQAALDHPQTVTIGHVLHSSELASKGISESKMDWAIVECNQDKTRVKNDRPDMDRAPREDPRSFRYMDKCDYWELAKLDYNQWICFHGSTSGVRSGYTNGMRTFINGTYEIEGLALDFSIMSDYNNHYVEFGFRIPSQRIMYAGKLASFAGLGDSGSVLWNEEGDMVGLLWGDGASGAFMTSIDEVVEDVKNKTGMDLEPIREE
jgi:hypothetical protein